MKRTWAMLLYIGMAVLAVVLLFVIKNTVLDTYATAEYNSLVTKVSGKVVVLSFWMSLLFCILFCETIRMELLAPGQAMVAYGGLVLAAGSVFLPETALDLKWMDVMLASPNYVYETMQGLVLATDALCVLGLLVLLVMILGSMNPVYKEKVKKAIAGVGCAVFVLSLASLGFKTFRFNGWLFVVSVIFTVLGCVIMFLYWTKKTLGISVSGSIAKWLRGRPTDEDEWEDEDEDDGNENRK